MCVCVLVCVIYVYVSCRCFCLRISFCRNRIRIRIRFKCEFISTKYYKSQRHTHTYILQHTHRHTQAHTHTDTDRQLTHASSQMEKGHFWGHRIYINPYGCPSPFLRGSSTVPLPSPLNLTPLHLRHCLRLPATWAASLATCRNETNECATCNLTVFLLITQSCC